MESTYNHKAVEAAAQSHWSQTNAYTVVENDPRFPKGKYYACSMLPYPSGKLHMGHVRNYTINDMMYRQLRMRGYNVLQPMGWDAFGLPAENAAMKNKVPPAKWTYENIAYMKKQMQSMGLAIDWSREMAACSPDYYRWNQWLFLKMLEKGIAYRKTQIVNWDPVDMTVLANEQVIDGRGWRTGAPVEKREIPGYYLKITDYAQELLDPVANPESPDYLKGWPDRVRAMQENWIGKSEGVRFAFPHDITDKNGAPIQDGKIYVFTTRADTIMGVTFVAVAPEHPLAMRAAERDQALALRIEALKAGGTTELELATKEKEGVATGLFVSHPLTGDSIELWVGNYVLMSYGDGAVMGVPAHDERDFAFAKKYRLAIKQVVGFVPSPRGGGVGGEGDGAPNQMALNATTLSPPLPPGGREFSHDTWHDWYGDKQIAACVNSGKYDGLSYKAAVDAVAADLAAKNLGEKKTTWRLRDWGISRQRYWGTPIPIVHCEEHGAQPVPYDQLPVILPEDCIPDGSGNPLHKHEGFHHGATCPVCGKAARRETDTMDTFVDSSWYFMRYTSPGNKEAMVDERNDYWMPMDQYIGGIEHAILHLLYARFWTKVMRDTGLVKFSEPFTKLLCQGMVLNHIFYTRGSNGGKDYYPPAEIAMTFDAQGRINGGTASDGSKVEYGGVGKMGKSERNGVDPEDMIEKYGADTSRLYMMFTAPPEATLEWNDAAVEGSWKFLRRVWNFAAKNEAALRAGIKGPRNEAKFSDAAKALRKEIHTTLKQINFDFERIQYNTVVSGCMKLLNAMEAADAAAVTPAALAECFSILLRVLYPVCPHITQSLWGELGYAEGCGELLNVAWADVDDKALVSDTVELVLQVNGKTRGVVVVASNADKATIEATAAASPDVAKFGEGRTPKKIIVVPGRLVNVVV
ncbi:MAG: leucine--tRNA ligase [Rhizobacter sp.]|nr:leucine--tRNA ligase [Burkholderiales bacterium]